MSVPWLLIPAIVAGKLTFFTDTTTYVLPSKARVRVEYRPREVENVIIFGLKIGNPRDYETKEVVYSDALFIDFVHPARDLVRWHRIPARESAVGEYPLFVPVTGESPPFIQIYNGLERTVEWDLTFRLYGVKEEVRREVFAYLSSIYRRLVVGVAV